SGHCPLDRPRGRHSRSRVAFSADGRTLVGAGLSASIRRWDLATGKELPPLTGKLLQQKHETSLKTDKSTSRTAEKSSSLSVEPAACRPHLELVAVNGSLLSAFSLPLPNIARCVVRCVARAI